MLRDRRLVVRIGDVHDLPDFVGQTLEDRLRGVRHEVEQGWAFGAREGARSPALFEFRCADETQFGLVFLMSFGVSAVSLLEPVASKADGATEFDAG